MIVQVFNGQRRSNDDVLTRKSAMQSDLVLVDTNRINWQNERLYEVVKDRTGKYGSKIVPEGEITEFTRNYESEVESEKSEPPHMA